MTGPDRPRLATVWLDGCSGCHMSFLDMDERLLELRERADLVYSPLVDAKDYPPEADLIYHTLNELLEGRMPDTAHIARFGA